MGNSEDKGTIIFSYLEHRKTIGLIGMSLPFILAIGAWLFFNMGLQSSVSHYYYTPMRGVFVGLMFVIGFFLLAYRGYDRRDDITGDIAFLGAVVLALFPTTESQLCGASATVAGTIHYAGAIVFFLSLIYFSLFLFTKSSPGSTPTPQKLKRNLIFRLCAYIMIAAIILLAAYTLGPDSLCQSLSGYRPVFWLEAIAILAFGMSWFVKGEAILKD
ncbi:MAG: DUF998 domain-containing protein [Gammaproteobacteria bacterium]|nr:DUF998 domain-containing protein [Gammaproteobacteria bacterium]